MRVCDSTYNLLIQVRLPRTHPAAIIGPLLIITSAVCLLQSFCNVCCTTCMERLIRYVVICCMFCSLLNDCVACLMTAVLDDQPLRLSPWHASAVYNNRAEGYCVQHECSWQRKHR